MKWLKDWMVNKKVNKLNLQNRSKKVVIPEKIKTIGILASSEVEFEALKAHIRNIWGYKVRVGGYFFSEKKELPVDGFSYVNFNLNGTASDYFSAFLEEEWDLLFLPSINLNDYLRFLLLQNKSKFSIGFYSEDTKPYLDLMVAYEAKDIHENIQNLINYLNKIKETC